MQDSLFGELFADLVGARKVAMLLGLRALGNQRLDGFIGEALARKKLRRHIRLASRFLRPLHRAARRLGIAIFNHVEHRIEIAQHVQHRLAIAGQKLSLVDGGIGRRAADRRWARAPRRY